MEKKVAILMTTFNSHKFLREQLDSFQIQTYKNWELWVSDDGSTDNTLEILNEYKNKWKNKVTILEGPKEGCAKNFWSLIHNKSINTDYYAFADHDDVWLENKIENAVNKLNNFSINEYLLYTSRYKIVDENLNFITDSPIIDFDISINISLVYCFAPGMTFVFNNKLKNLATKIPLNENIEIHDHLLCMLNTAVNGITICDDYISILYRQHDNNEIGFNYKDLTSYFHRFIKLIDRKKKNIHILESRIKLLNYIKDYMTDESINTINNINIMKENLYSRAKIFNSNIIYRPKSFENFILKVLFTINLI